MTNRLMAAAVVAIAAVAGASAAMAAEGPRASSENFIASAPAAGVSDYDPSRSGPKASSENRIAPTANPVVANAQPTGAQHWVYVEGYEKGIWRRHWQLVP